MGGVPDQVHLEAREEPAGEGAGPVPGGHPAGAAAEEEGRVPQIREVRGGLRPREPRNEGEDAANAVPAGDRLGVYEVYVARATELYGLLKARDVYRQAIVGGGLPDEGARAMCVGFADIEIGLGEVARARALYAYAAAFTDPEVCPEFW